MASVLPSSCKAGVSGWEPFLKTAEVHKFGSHFGLTADECRRMWIGVEAVSNAPVDNLTALQRVYLLNAALRIAVKARDQKCERGLATAAKKVGMRLSLPREKLTTLGTVEAALEPWLGPAPGWKGVGFGDDGPRFHESAFDGTRRFRAIISKKRHAIFSQLAVLDSTGEPFLTSVVADLEMRAGESGDSVACVALFDGACGLRPLERGKDHVHLGSYVRIDKDGTANCRDCHGGKIGLVKPTAMESEEALERRTSVFLRRLKEWISSMK